MKSLRLLPVVIFAAVALLLFKGVGLLTNGGYVLVGVTMAEAAGGGSSAEPVSAADGMPSLLEPTMTDSAPTAVDAAPTLPLRPEAEAGHGSETADAHSTPAGGAIVACPPASDSAPADGHGAAPAVECDPNAVTAEGDAVPMVRDASGKLVPYSSVGTSEGAVEERLGERRTELEAREQELEMRMALVEAAEKRIEERTALLEQLEARINALVDENKSAEVEQFKGIVSMYETMKPKDAALIFDELDMGTLLRVARAMNPRKMAPVMAKMNPIKAKDLTANMAVTPTEPTVAVTSEDLAALPQIVGQ